MTHIHYITDMYAAHPSPGWDDMVDFKSKGLFVNDSAGSLYKIVAKHVRNLTALKRVKTVFWGILQFASATLTGRPKTSLIKLFTKKHESKKVALKLVGSEVFECLRRRLAQSDSLTNQHAKLQILNHIASNAETSSSVSGQCRRIVHKISTKDNQEIFVKAVDLFGLNMRDVLLGQKNTPHEELAYLISELFQLHVVPFTISDINFVIQKRVKVDTAGKEKKDDRQLQTILLFNIILGRRDAQERNSVWTSNGKLLEIDNEELGNTHTDSWVFSVFNANTPLDNTLIEQITAAKNEPLTHLAKMYSKKTIGAIIDNLNRLTKFVASKEQVTIKDLQNAFYRP